MFKKILRGLFTLMGIALGFLCGKWILQLQKLSYFDDNVILKIIFLIFSSLFLGLILFLLSPVLSSLITKFIEYLEDSIQKTPAVDVLIGVVGGIIGLLISIPIASLFNESVIGKIIGVIIVLIVALVLSDVFVKKKEDIIGFAINLRKPGNIKEKKIKSSYKGIPKVLDTSVIIDGRILDICQTGFIEGTLVIPNFVLDELRHIADSSDSLKRNRGRRGLDILNSLQKELGLDVHITDRDFPEIEEVDSKLLKLGKVLKGKVITNDYNLNKVAGVQGVPVLNINELANAVKPVVLPGEEMTLQIIKDGKEQEQGIGYLDDGTMIVVEGGRRHIGEVMDVIVTSVLQTAAGRMIFARQKR
ncbi:PIN/TRAM domain-containing protein [Clostridium botulinum]|uniref:PIN/TRAM domain-containing protein n=1 Tax=Clostridium botulinum TaxID=1491 RepID=UPI001E5E1F0A|nr:PIN domain-containing protein [Clostridium botulinum]MCD3276615.1 TRAM domain-containing protein [Clostridium botulinum C/D]MCD3288147.1 TRAM domain-containing protein [Clostridium botulinum C/D]MCD3290678.1 TRAM domain-containing protein [Clostridium botulinum C/D]MCD3301524.1 TRAM domain-containing protein [Clostridium botulinum C/D]